MEIRVIGRGALAGLIAGVLGFVFARIFAEPVINKAIDYESGRDDILNALRSAAGLAQEPDGPEIFSRTIQSTVGIATGIIGLSVAFGAVVAVVFLVVHGRYNIRPQQLVWLIAGLGFLALFALPYVKYPSNPPAIGHTFTIRPRGELYLGMVAISTILVLLGVLLAHRLAPRFGWVKAVVASALAVLVVYGIVIGLLPSLGNLSANVAASNEFGFARAATETPQPITNVLNHALTVDGVTYQPGQIVYPGFDADVLWKFRWYSLLNQMLIWLTIALVFGGLMQRLLLPAAGSRPTAVAAQPTDEHEPVEIG